MRTVEWQDGAVLLIDQKALPWKLEQVELRDYRAVASAITDMTVRGAPAIGATAAFGLALAAQQSPATTLTDLLADLEQAAQVLKDARPTAVNRAWAVDRLMALATAGRLTTPDAVRDALLTEAQRIADEDVAINQRIGMHGATLITEGSTVLHHCNTGALATVDHGTALGVVRSAFEQGTSFHVLLDETRPRLQGSRLSAWELERLGVDYDIIADTAAGYAALSLYPKGFGVLTTEFKVNLLNPGRGRRLVARGRVIKPGRTLTVTASDVYGQTPGEADIHVATGLFTMIALEGLDD